MKAAGKVYEPVTYEGAGHGFMRAGQAPDAKPADKQAFDEGFARLLKELKANTTGASNKQTRADGTQPGLLMPAESVAQAAVPNCCATILADAR